MRISTGATRLLAFILLLAPVVMAQAEIPPPAPIEARGYVLIDFQTGKVLAARDEHKKLEPASLTKLMTAYTTYKALQDGALKLTDQIRVSENAWRTGGAGSGGSTTMLPINSSASAEIMLRGMIIQSGNDASIALAEHISGSEEAFSDLMNRHARELGMRDTHFMNSTGLPHPEHYSSAADIATLSRAIIREFPEHYAWYAEKEYVFNGIRQGNRNLLLYRDPTVDGIKTGHTASAGFCLAASAKRGDMRLISVVMGMANEQARAKASQELLNYGFRFYETRRLQEGGKPLAQARVWKGAAETVSLGVAQDLWVILPRGSADDLHTGTESPRDLVAPIAAGSTQGKLRISAGGKVIAEAPLVALAAVDEGTLWKQAVDTALLWFE